MAGTKRLRVAMLGFCPGGPELNGASCGRYITAQSLVYNFVLCRLAQFI
jgi:hypothetical protein